MTHIIIFDQWVMPIQDLGSYDGPEIDSQLVFNTMNDKTQDLNLTITKPNGNDSVVVSSGLVDQQSVSHQIIGPKYLTKSCLQPKQSELDQDDVKIVVPKIPGNFCIECVTKRLNITDRKEVYGSIDRGGTRSATYTEETRGAPHGPRRHEERHMD